MRRRDVLRFGGVLIASPVGGCSAPGTPIDGTESSPTRMTPRETRTPVFEWLVDDSSPFATVELGSRDAVANPDRNRPHEVMIWNDLDRKRNIRIRITEGETARLDETQTFPAQGAMRLRLLEPGAYGLEVFVGDGRAGAFMIPRSLFDCNYSRTNTRITQSGGLQRQTVSTEIGCPPQVSHSVFLLGDRRCGRGNDAMVSIDGEGIRIRGTIEAPTPCHGAEIGSIEFEGASGTLRVNMVTTEPPPFVSCVRCLGVIDYQVEVALDRDTPGNVVVTHDGEEVI